MHKRFFLFMGSLVCVVMVGNVDAMGTDTEREMTQRANKNFAEQVAPDQDAQQLYIYQIPQA